MSTTTMATMDQLLAAAGHEAKVQQLPAIRRAKQKLDSTLEQHDIHPGTLIEMVPIKLLPSALMEALSLGASEHAVMKRLMVRAQKLGIRTPDEYVVGFRMPVQITAPDAKVAVLGHLVINRITTQGQKFYRLEGGKLGAGTLEINAKLDYPIHSDRLDALRFRRGTVLVAQQQQRKLENGVVILKLKITNPAA